MPAAIHRTPLLFLLVVIAAILIEAVWRRASGRGFDGANALASVGVAGGQVISGALGGVVMSAAFLAAWQAAPRQLPLDDWRVWAVGFFAVEFAYYWMHRWSHTVRWMWATHSVHHSSAEYSLTAAYRLGWTGLVSGAWLTYLPLVLAGFHPVLVAGLLAFNLRFQFFLHTEAVGRLGPLEWVFNTPAHHRVHHASDAPYLDKNFGGVLIVFDRLFGKFAAAPACANLTYGLVDPMRSRNPVVIALREWGRMFKSFARARGVRARWRALFGRPNEKEEIATSARDCKAA